MGEFEARYRETRPALVALCKRYLRDKADAEALAHDAFVRAWESWDRYAADRAFWPWLATIAHRLCINELTRAARRTEILADSVRVLADSRPSAADEAARTLDRQQVHQVLHRLPLRQRRLLHLRDLEGWSYDEIAHAEGVSIESVRGALKRARAAFRRTYETVANGVLAGIAPLLRRAVREGERAVAGLGSRLLGYEPMAAALTAALLLGPGTPGAAAPTAPPPKPPVAVSAGVAGPAVPVEAPTPATPAKAPDRLEADGPPPLPTTAPADEERPLETIAAYGLDYTPSPSYQEDHTVFASGSERCDAATYLSWCPVYYRSTDGGETWRPMRAEGAPTGRILLPPAYPRDRRIFLVGSGLWLSEDDGATFRHIGDAGSQPAMSPRFSDGDPRMFVGVAYLFRPLPAAREYNVEEGTSRPLSFPLPLGAAPVTFAFSPSYAADRAVLMGGLEIPTTLKASSLQIPTVYSCTAASCERVLTLSRSVTPPNVLWSTGGSAFAWTTYSLHRSLDGGHTFESVTIPGQLSTRLLTDLDAGADGRLYASVWEPRGKVTDADTQLYVSDDDGATWRPVGEETEPLSNRIVLPDGTMLAARSAADPNSWPSACSRDGGVTWRDRCGG